MKKINRINKYYLISYIYITKLLVTQKLKKTMITKLYYILSCHILKKYPNIHY